RHNRVAASAHPSPWLPRGEPSSKPVYDHTDGTFARPEFVTPKPVVLIHGLHALFPPELRRLWDVSVFLDPDPELRIAWKIQRDMSKRGYTRAEVVQQLEERRYDSEHFVMPQ